jgi:hypothetical protein
MSQYILLFFSYSTLEDIYYEIFETIRDNNVRYNQEASLHIPNDWNVEDYRRFLEIFN